MTLYVGCYTTPESPFGLHALGCDPATGALRLLGSTAVEAAIYQQVTPDGRFLVSCTQGGLVAFRIEGARLSLADRLLWGGPCLCHVAVTPDGSRVCWADYLEPSAGSVGFADGRFRAETLVRHVHSGSGPNRPRQDGAHCHQAAPLPEGGGYCVVDLGQDRVVTYPGGVAAATVPPGAGPRHLVFHPDGRHLLLVSELGNLVTSYRRRAGGALDFVSQRPTVPPDWRGVSTAAAIRVSGDGRRVFVSNRGHDSIATFAFDPATGVLSDVAVAALPGMGPRDFDFVPGAEVAVVAFERSGTVASFRCDLAVGTFSLLSELRGFHRPVSIAFSKNSADVQPREGR